MDILRTMCQFYEKYSKDGILFLSTFGLNVVFVGDFDTLKQIYNHPDVQHRAHSDPRKCIFTHKIAEDRGEKMGPLKGLIFSQEKTWVEQRRFTLRVLRDFGFGKSSMEELIQDEVKQFTSFLKQFTDVPVDFEGKFNLPVLNSLWRISSGESFEYTDQQLVNITKKLTEFFKKTGQPISSLFLTQPWIFKLFPNFLGRRDDMMMNRSITHLMEESIVEHKRTLDASSPRDFIDTMLIEIMNTTDEDSSFYKETGIRNLVNTMFDLFMAGAETTSTTLMWAILYLVREQEIQSKVHAELDSVIGQSRLPSLSDRQNLPYTEAVIYEIQRCGNVMPTGVQHMTSKPIQINGFHIPADTIINPFYPEIHKGDYWRDGHVFRPERFLDDSGKLKPDEHLIPFCIGKRRCLGEPLAKAELFLFITSLVQAFQLLPESPDKVPTEEYQTGITVQPKPFKLVLKTRL